MTTPPFRDVRLRGFRDRADVDEVVRLLDARLAPLPAESVPLARLAGRVLAADVVAEAAVPGFDRAAMDGYALRGEETFGASLYNPLALTVIGESMPGRPFAGSVRPGQAVRIMTGSPVPEGADAVLPVEQAREEAGQLLVSEPIAPGRHVGRRGEDIEPGRVVFTAGRRLRPQDAALLASIGVGTASVVRQPRVEILITGDELLPAGSRPEGYRIVDSNSVMLAALLRRDGVQERQSEMVEQRLAEGFEQGMEHGVERLDDAGAVRVLVNCDAGNIRRRTAHNRVLQLLL